MSEDFKTPSQIADEARKTGHNAADAIIDLIQTFGATTITRNIANLTPMSIGNLVFSDRNNNGLFAKASDFQETAARRIADEPLKAVAIGAAAGALLAALLMRRGRNRRDD